jgi:ectoine hydroxylase-related dioxygenase (phytanoyl-CoA dioxygenase family)
MRVVAGSHRQDAAGLDQYEAVDKVKNVFDVELKKSLIDESKIVNLELAPGECHFHDSWTVHGSNPNNSDKRRCGYTMRYMPANVKHSPDPKWPHQVYLVRGTDRTDGHNVYTPIPSF